MSILTFPSITPNAAEFGLVSNTQNSRSELNGAIQTLGLPGDIWMGTLTFTNVFDPNARILRAFLTSLRGQAGRFYLTPPACVRAGSAGGSPIVKGAGQTGAAINIDGCTPNITGWIMAGDFFQIGTELKMATADANSDSGGNATISFVPPIRVSPADNGAVVVNSPKAIMMLTNGNQARWQAQPTPIYAMSLAVEEALDF